MKKGYDFSKAVKGKFYKKGAKLHLPIYLNMSLQNRLERLAQKKHLPMSDLVSRFLRKELQLG